MQTQVNSESESLIEALFRYPLVLAVCLWLAAVALALVALRRRALLRKERQARRIDATAERDGSEYIDVRTVRHADALIWPDD